MHSMKVMFATLCANNSLIVFCTEGELRKIDPETGKAGTQTFDFNITPDHRENQKHYEALGDVITEHVYGLLDAQGLHRIYLPRDASTHEASFIYCTQKELKNPKKLMILIHGSGVVRAGQWARSLIINDPGLKAGSVLPYIERARAHGYEVLITNTNLNYYRTKENNDAPIKGSETPSSHALTVWNEIVLPAQPEAVAIVAHSYGGVVVVDMSNKFVDFFKKYVFAIGMTDSVHFGGKLTEQIQDIGRNWVTSTQPLDTPLRSSKNDVPHFSAGNNLYRIAYHNWADNKINFF